MARNLMLRAQKHGNKDITAGFQAAYDNWKSFHSKAWISWARGKAREDVERFLKWGETNKFNDDTVGDYNNMMMLDGVAQKDGVHSQRLRRRKALAKVIQAGWWGWLFANWIDPSLMAELDGTLTDEELDERKEAGTLADFERLQQLQDRANKDYYEDHRHRTQTRAWVAIGVSIALALCSFINPLFIAAAICIIELTLAVLALVASVVSAVVLHIQEQIENDETLTREQKEEWNAILSIINSAATVVTTIATLGIRGLLQKAAKAAKTAATTSLTVLMAALRAAMLLVTFHSLLQKVDRWLKLLGVTGRMNTGSEWYHDVTLWLTYFSDFVNAAAEQLSQGGSRTEQGQPGADQLGDQPTADAPDGADDGAGEGSASERAMKGAWSVLKGTLRFASSLAGLSALRDLYKLFSEQQQQQQQQQTSKQQEQEKEEQDVSEFIAYKDSDKAFTAEMPGGKGKLETLVADTTVHAKGKPASSRWFSAGSWFGADRKTNPKSVHNGGKSQIVKWTDAAGKVTKVVMDLVRGGISIWVDGPMDLELQRLILEALGYKQGEHYELGNGEFVPMKDQKPIEGEHLAPLLMQDTDTQPGSPSDKDRQNKQTFVKFFQLLTHLEGKDHQSEETVFGVAAHAFQKLEKHLKQLEGVKVSESKKLKSVNEKTDGKTEIIMAGDQNALDVIQGKEGATESGEGVRVHRFTPNQVGAKNQEGVGSNLGDKEQSGGHGSRQVDLAAAGKRVTVQLNEGKQLEATSALSKAEMPLLEFMLKLFNIPRDMIAFDKAGTLIPNPKRFPGISLQPLKEVKDANSMTKSFVQALQVMHFIRRMEQNNDIAKATQDAEEITVQALYEGLEDAAFAYSESPASQEQNEQLAVLRERVGDQVMEGFGFKKGTDYTREKDGKLQAKELDNDKNLDKEGIKTKMGDQFTDWGTMQYLTLRKLYSESKAKEMFALSFRPNNPQDNIIAIFIRQFGNNDKMKSNPILSNSAQPGDESEAEKQTSTSKKDDSWTGKGWVKSLAQAAWRLVQIRFAGCMLMLQGATQFVKIFFQKTSLSPKGKQPDALKIIEDVWSGRISRGVRELKVLSRDLPNTVQVHFRAEPTQDAISLSRAEFQQDDTRGPDLRLEITAGQDGSGSYSTVVKETDGTTIDVDLGSTNDLEGVFRKMLFVKKLQQFREEGKEDATDLAKAFATDSYNMQIFVENGRIRATQDADLRNLYTASDELEHEAKTGASDSNWWSAKKLSDGLLQFFQNSYLALFHRAKLITAEARQFVQTWSHAMNTTPAQDHDASECASTVTSNQKIGQPTGNTGNDNSENIEALSEEESFDIVKRYHNIKGSNVNTPGHGRATGDTVDRDQVSVSTVSEAINDAVANALEAELKFLAEDGRGSEVLKVFLLRSDTAPGKRKIILLDHGGPAVPRDPSRQWLGDQREAYFGKYGAKDITRVLNANAKKNDFEVEEVILLGCHVPESFALQLQTEMGVTVKTLGQYTGASPGQTILVISAGGTYEYHFDPDPSKDTNRQQPIRKGPLTDILNALHRVGGSSGTDDWMLDESSFTLGNSAVKRYGQEGQHESTGPEGLAGGREGEGEDEVVPESEATQQPSAPYEFAGPQQFREAIENDVTKFNAEVEYKFVRTSEGKYIVSEQTDGDDELVSAVGHLRWSTEPNEDGDEKGWVINDKGISYFFRMSDADADAVSEASFVSARSRASDPTPLHRLTDYHQHCNTAPERHQVPYAALPREAVHEFWSGHEVESLPDGEYIYVRLPHGQYRFLNEDITYKRLEGTSWEGKAVGHSSLTQGWTVLAAGTVTMRDGVAVHVDNASGHFMPEADTNQIQAGRTFPQHTDSR